MECDPTDMVNLLYDRYNYLRKMQANRSETVLIK